MRNKDNVTALAIALILALISQQREQHSGILPDSGNRRVGEDIRTVPEGHDPDSGEFPWQELMEPRGWPARGRGYTRPSLEVIPIQTMHSDHTNRQTKSSPDRSLAAGREARKRGFTFDSL
jgi:hypothetical protein